MGISTKRFFSIEFMKHIMKNILKFLGCLVVATAIIYFFIDKSIIINPTSKTIISICVVTIVYIVYTIIAWFSLGNNNK